MTHIRTLLFVAVAAAFLIIIPLAATGHWKSEKVEEKTAECKWGRKNYVYLPSDKALSIKTGASQSGTSSCHLSGVTFGTNDPQSYWEYSWSAEVNGLVQIAPACTSSMCTEFKALPQSQRLQYCRGLCDCDKSCVGYDYRDAGSLSQCSIYKSDVWHSSCTILPTSLVHRTINGVNATNPSAATVGPMPPS